MHITQGNRYINKIKMKETQKKFNTVHTKRATKYT